MPSSRAAFAVIAVGLLAVALLAVAVGKPGGILGGGYRPALADPVPYDGRSPAQPSEARERVLVELPRPALGQLPDAETRSARSQRSYVRSLRAEADALLSALDARGVKTTDVTTFERTWHGFAATVSAKDLPGLQSLGVRLRPNRRFYPATGEPLGRPRPVAAPRAGAPEVALIGGGALKAVLETRGVRVRELPVGATRGGETFARTDEVLEALERAADPDHDGDTSDHVHTVALGVSAPYAGFADAPEAQAAVGAERLGMLVVAPAGHEGPAGTIGSPAASPGALAVAPRSSGADVARAKLTVGGVETDDAAVLGRGIPSGSLRTGRDGLAVVRAGANPGAQVETAVAAGARAVLLAEPRDGVPLPAMPAGRIAVPVLGLTGAAARDVLDEKPGAEARAGGLRIPQRLVAGTRVSRFASTGPAFDGAAKPELTRPGSALAGGRLVAGAGVAAALAAAEAAGLRQDDPQAARQRLLDGAPRRRDVRRRVPVGVPQVRRDGKAIGVEFTVGTFRRGDAAAGRPTTIVPAARLTLTLERADGTAVETLTPAGGEHDVLPARYAYTLPSGVVDGLTAGNYRFRVAARAPRQPKATVRRSATFAAG